MRPSPDRSRPRRSCRSIVALTSGVVAFAFLPLGTAYAHDPQRPELNAWFKCLTNKAGEPCCDSGDGQHAGAEWGMAKGGFRVLPKNPQRPDEQGKWFYVPYSAVIDTPNLSGVAMVWWWPSYEMDGTMTPIWRRFIPGPGG